MLSACQWGATSQLREKCLSSEGYVRILHTPLGHPSALIPPGPRSIQEASQLPWHHGMSHSRPPLLRLFAVRGTSLFKIFSLSLSQLLSLIHKALHCSVQFSHSVMSYSLRFHELQHARLPCPSPTPGVYPNSCPLSQWCHLTISSSVIPFSSCPQSFPASGSFQMSQLFASGGQNIGVSASTSVLPMNIQDWFPFGWTGWISLQSKGLSRVFSNTTVQKHQFFGAQLSL